jgi:hypothetical protein
VYIVSFGPIESANTYDGVFTIFPEEQESVIATAPLAPQAAAARAERHDASSARRIGRKPIRPRGIQVTSRGSVDYRCPVAGGAPEVRPIRCEECGAPATGDAWGWRGYRIDDPEDGDLPEIGFFCPDCAYREFGPLLDRRDRSDGGTP